jgi:hypothetical protein
MLVLNASTKKNTVFTVSDSKTSMILWLITNKYNLQIYIYWCTQVIDLFNKLTIFQSVFTVYIHHESHQVCMHASMHTKHLQ